MYSQKENLKKLKKTYKEQAIPKGLKRRSASVLLSKSNHL